MIGVSGVIKPQLPTVGRIVLYMRYGSPGGEHLPEMSPAIVVKVLNHETSECQLVVFNPNGMYYNPTPYSEEPKPGHWSWMPYQKTQHEKHSAEKVK